jgi:hypothetical protein
MKTVFWVIFAATIVIYAVMVAWSLPIITANAGGLLPFDLRPMGYSFEEASAFVRALSEEGRGFYRAVQHRLDLVYPALLAAVLVLATLLLTPTRWGALRWLLALPALPGMVFDYLENRAVAAMLSAGVDGLTPEMVEQASLWTQLKSGFTTLSMVVVLLLLGRYLVLRWRGWTQ